MAYRPLLSRSARPATYMVEARDESGELQPTPITGEHPLPRYVDKREILTMMTLEPVAAVQGPTSNHAPAPRLVGR